MPWFYCDRCCDTIKKPKVSAHLRQCPGASFTCIDCSRNFDSRNVQTHNSCVTEEQKYAQAATKPGGIAAGGYYNEKQPAKEVADAVGHQYLSTHPPWKCSICNVSCTSKETLLSHASGMRHQRRCKATAAAQQGNTEANNASQAEQTDAAEGQESVPADAQDGAAAAAAAAAAETEDEDEQHMADFADVQGRRFLCISTEPSWKCTLCNAPCSSKEALLAHASGAKHRKKCKSAAAAQLAKVKSDEHGEQGVAGTSTPAGASSAAEAAASPTRNQAIDGAKEQKKKRKRSVDVEGSGKATKAANADTAEPASLEKPKKAAKVDTDKAGMLKRVRRAIKQCEGAVSLATLLSTIQSKVAKKYGEVDRSAILEMVDDEFGEELLVTVRPGEQD